MKNEETLIIKALENANIKLSSATYKKLFHFISLLLETNQTINLTSITDYKEALVKHIFDSLIISNLMEFVNAKSILDVGSGAGIPGIPLAVAYPEKKIISIDTVQKKIKFQEQICQILDIKNHIPIWGRAEDLAKQPKYRESFNLVVARALAPMNILAELTLPFLEIGGFALLYKGKDFLAELEKSENAVTVLGGVLINIKNVDLPENYGTRNIIVLKKMNPTPEKFPRKPGIPQKKPLF